MSLESSGQIDCALSGSYGVLLFVVLWILSLKVVSILDVVVAKVDFRRPLRFK